MLNPVRVLIVEDDVLVAEALATMLEQLGIEITGIAATAAAALALAQGHRPDVALVDIGLRDAMDGIDLAVALRRVGVPSILQTGQWGPELSSRAEAARPIGHLLKPYRPQDLVDLICRCMERSG